MKKLITICLTAVMILTLAACGNSASTDSSSDKGTAKEEKDREQASAAKDDDVLILYFSAANSADADAVTSATPLIDGVSSVEWIADIIRDRTGGELVPIIPSESYPTGYDELADQAEKEEKDNSRPAFEDIGVDPSAYSTIFIGYPVWWYTTPMIIQTFFDEYDLSGVTIIPFNTHEGSSDGGTYDLIRELEPDAEVLEGIPIRGNDAGSDDAEKEIEQWLKGLGL